jgi:hypothetical protein
VREIALQRESELKFILQVSNELHTLPLTATPRASRGAATYAVEAPMRARTTKLRSALNCIKPVSYNPGRKDYSRRCTFIVIPPNSSLQGKERTVGDD